MLPEIWCRKPQLIEAVQIKEGTTLDQLREWNREVFKGLQVAKRRPNSPLNDAIAILSIPGRTNMSPSKAVFLLPSQWVVRFEDGGFAVMTDREFRRKYQRSDNDA